jgi:hypothetical protein
MNTPIFDEPAAGTGSSVISLDGEIDPAVSVPVQVLYATGSLFLEVNDRSTVYSRSGAGFRRGSN